MTTKISTLLAFFLSLLILTGFIPMRFGALDNTVENMLRAAGADSASVKAVRVTLWRGVQVRGLETYKRIGGHENYRIRTSRADIHGNIFMLGVTMLFSPESFGIKPDRDIFREAYEKPLEFNGRMFGQMVSLRSFQKIKLYDANIHITDKEGKSGISASGISANIRKHGSHRHGQWVTGSIAAAEAVMPPLAKIENFNMHLRACADTLSSKDISGTIFGGKLRAALYIHFDDDIVRIGSNTVQISGLDLERWNTEMGFVQGRLAGKATVKANLELGRVTTLDSMKAEGNLTVTNFVMEDLSIQKLSIVSQISKNLRLLQFSEIKGKFRFADRRIRFDGLTGIGEILNFKTIGWVGFDKRWNLELEGEFSNTFTAGLSRLVRGALAKTGDGGRRFNCKITGTIDRPRLDISGNISAFGMRGKRM